MSDINRPEFLTRTSTSSGSSDSTSSFIYSTPTNLVQSLSSCYNTISESDELSPRIGAASAIYTQPIFVVGGLSTEQIKSVDETSVETLNGLLAEFSSETIAKWLHNDMHYLDLVSRKWFSLTPSNPRSEWPAPRMFHSVIVSKHKLYLYGGVTLASDPQCRLVVCDDLWQFDLSSRSWSLLTKTNCPRYKCTLNIIHDTSGILPHLPQKYANEDSLVISNGCDAHGNSLIRLVLIYNLAHRAMIESGLEISLPEESSNNNTFLLAIPFSRTSIYNDTLLSFVNTPKRIIILSFSTHNRSFSQSVAIDHVAGDCPVAYLSPVTGFMLGNSNLIIVGWRKSSLQVFLLNIPTRKWSHLDTRCSVHPSNFHLFSACFLWRNHGKLILLGADNITPEHRPASVTQHFQSFVVVDLSFCNIITFSGPQHNLSLTYDDESDTKREKFKLFKQVYRNEIIQEAKVSLSVQNQDNVVFKNSPPLLSTPSSSSINGPTLDAHKRSTFAKRNDEEKAKFQKNIDFENYVNYLVPDTEVKLNTSALNYFNATAVALGRNFFQRYANQDSNPLADFQFVSADEDSCSIPLNVVIKRWGLFFTYMLAFAYLKNVELLSKKIENDQGVSLTGPARMSKKSVVSTINSMTDSLGSQKRYGVTTDGGQTGFDDENFEHDIIKNSRSPLTFSLLSKMRTGIPAAELAKTNSRQDHPTKFYQAPKDSAASLGSSSDTKLNDLRLSPLAHPGGKIVFNSPFENNKKHAVPIAQFNTSPHLSEPFVNYNDLINLPSSRKNSVISNTSSFISNNSELLANHNNRSGSRSLLSNKQSLVSSPTRDATKLVASTMDERRTSSAAATAVAIAAAAAASSTVSNVEHVAIPEQPPIPKFPPPLPQGSETSMSNSSSSIFADSMNVDSSSQSKLSNEPLARKMRENLACGPKDNALAPGSLLKTGHSDPARLFTSSLGGSSLFDEIQVFVNTLNEYEQHFNGACDKLHPHGLPILDTHHDHQEDKENETKDGFSGEGTSDFKHHFLLEPLLIPRSLYLPVRTPTVKTLCEFFLTGQISNKTAINPVLMELYTVSKFYDIPLLYNICSEILYAIVGKKENFLVNYIDFLEFEVDELTFKMSTKRQELVEKQADPNTISEADMELRDLKKLKKTLYQKFAQFRHFMTNIDFNGNYLLEILKCVADLNLELRQHHKKKPQNNHDVDSDDDGYETDELDDMSYVIAFNEFIYQDHRTSSYNSRLKNMHSEKTQHLLRVEDISNSIEPPPVDLIRLIYEYAVVVVDSKLMLRTLYLLQMIKMIEITKKPVEAKIKDDLYKEFKEREKELKLKRQEEHQQELERKMKEEQAKKAEKVRIQEVERAKVEKERVKEEHRIKKQQLKKLFREKQQEQEKLHRQNTNEALSASSSLKKKSSVEPSDDPSSNDLLNINNQSKTSLVSKSSSLEKQKPVLPPVGNDAKLHLLLPSKSAASLSSGNSATLNDSTNQRKLHNTSPPHPSKPHFKPSIFQRRLHGKKSTADFSDVSSGEYFSDNPKTQQKLQKQQNQGGTKHFKPFQKHHQYLTPVNSLKPAALLAALPQQVLRKSPTYSVLDSIDLNNLEALKNLSVGSFSARSLTNDPLDTAGSIHSSSVERIHSPDGSVGPDYLPNKTPAVGSTYNPETFAKVAADKKAGHKFKLFHHNHNKNHKEKQFSNNNGGYREKTSQ